MVTRDSSARESGGRDRRERGPRQRRERPQEEDSGLIERVVQIRRVAKVTKGGRHLTFNAMVVVGDGAGHVGASLGKAGAVPDAVRKGTLNARKQMKAVTLNGATIPHEITAKFGACQVLLRPATPGTGIKAGGGVRAVLEAAGVRDILSKSYGSRNTINTVKATLLALDTLREPRAVLARRRGEQPPTA
jgi:small subunit ribosomal protein S5